MIMKLDFFSTDFRKILQYQIPRLPVQWQPSCSVWTDGRKNKHGEVNSRLSQFCKGA